MTRDQWFIPRRPTEIEPYPWLSDEATQYLENLLTPDMEVLEFGAGGSTLWFASRVKHVTSFEHDPDWQYVVKKNAPENVTLTDMKAYVLSHANCDLLFIDGEPVNERADWLQKANELVKPGGYVVLDNANRPEYKKEREEFAKHAKLLHTIDSNAHGKVNTEFLVTEFWQCE